MWNDTIMYELLAQNLAKIITCVRSFVQLSYTKRLLTSAGIGAQGRGLTTFPDKNQGQSQPDAASKPMPRYPYMVHLDLSTIHLDADGRLGSEFQAILDYNSSAHVRCWSPLTYKQI